MLIDYLYLKIGLSMNYKRCIGQINRLIKRKLWCYFVLRPSIYGKTIEKIVHKILKKENHPLPNLRKKNRFHR
jgi:hypothetical protein